jgi:hypothetical protein
VRASLLNAAGSGGSGGGKSANGFRLTLTTATPVTTTDVTGASTVYLTPYSSNELSLYDGSKWTVYTTAEISIALSSLTSGKNYDIFAYYDIATAAVKLELSAAWSSDTARSDAVSRQDGVMVKTGDTTRRLVGTIRTTSTTTTEDSKAKRFVLNQSNRTKRELYINEATDSWSYTTASYRAANGAATNCFEYVGDTDTMLDADALGIASGSSAVTVASGIGIDSATVSSAQTHGITNNTSSGVVMPSTYRGRPGLGYHKITWLEFGGTGITMYGDVGAPTAFQAGMVGVIEG